MLATSVGIISPSSSGGGVYQFQLFFQNGAQAIFLRTGDVVQSGVTGDRYQITTWATFPSDFSSGTVVTANFLDNDVTPTADSGFNSTAFTPNQVDVRPFISTEGLLGNISTFSGQNFEYQLQASWNDLTQANYLQLNPLLEPR